MNFVCQAARYTRVSPDILNGTGLAPTLPIPLSDSYAHYTQQPPASVGLRMFAG
jgi:hypothetical protein